MSPSRSAGSCEHCGLVLGPWPHERESNGEAVQFCCYGCFIGWQVSRGGSEETAAVGLLVRLGVGAFLAMNIMLFSLAIYSGGFEASEPWVQQVFHYVLWAFATPTMVVLGGPFFMEAGRDIARGRIGASVLISIGALAAYVYSAIATFTGEPRVYFDTETLVLGLFSIGRFLEAIGRARAMRDVAPLLQPQLSQVSVVRDGACVPTPLREVRRGDVVRVLAGDRISVDGEILEGSGFVDESWLTGESRPLNKTAGEQVLGGTINLDGVLDIRATAGGLETRWAGICDSLRHALAQPSALQSVTDRFAAWFVPAVLVLALGTAYYWGAQGDGDVALMNGLAVLVVACPCALGLAAPLATALTLARLAREGVLVRSGDALHGLANVRRLAVDKTGTLTVGTVRVARVDTHGKSREEVLRQAGSLEAQSRHPIARGIVAAAVEGGLTLAPADSVRTVPGCGVAGRVEGVDTAVGAPRWFAERNWEAPSSLHERASSAHDSGRASVFVGSAGMVHAIIVLDDEVQADAARSAAQLRGMGIEVCLLSGDCPGPVERIAYTCGIERWVADALPQDKVDFIASWESGTGASAMLGDGINDGPALQAADIGIAVGDAADIARETADVVLPGAGLSALPSAIALARRSQRIVASNIAWALGYNAVAIGLAAMGLLQPVIAAALMAGSSFVVILNSLRLSGGPVDAIGTKPDKMRSIRVNIDGIPMVK